MSRFLFPRWSNRVLPLVVVFGLGPASTAAVGAVWYYGTQKHTEVGYAPVQPVDFSHKLHAGELGMDCRYCHSTVERASFAAVPTTQTCMNCHAHVRTDSPRLAPVRESYDHDTPLEWVRVHNLPDFVFFDHSAHLGAGVGCESCHGRIDQMVRVTQEQPLTMGWCLECHRNPDAHLRPRSEITTMNWQPTAAPGEARGQTTVASTHWTSERTGARTRKVSPPLHCSGCHR